MPDTVEFKLLVQPAGPFGSYVEKTAPDASRALGLLEAAKIATWAENGKDRKPVFLGDDRLSILGPDGVELKAWSRDQGDIGPDLISVGKQPIVGWQIINSDGWNIHSENEDPFGLASYEILTAHAVATAIAWAAENEGYAVVPVRDGDIEDPSYVGIIELAPQVTPKS